MIKRMFLVVALIAVILSFVGCQTVQGIGGDIKWIGESTAELLEGGGEYE